MLEARSVVSTKFFSTLTMQTLGLEACTVAMLRACGLGPFYFRSAPSHPRLTREFLASLRVRAHSGVIQSIQFNLLGNTYTLTMDELRAALGVEMRPTGDWSTEAIGTQPMDWWTALTGAPFSSRGEVNYLIHHPALKIAHKVINMCFLGQVEVNKIPNRDLAFLWALSHECTMIPAWAEMFVQRCKDCRTAGGKKIALGGMVSLIAMAVTSIDHLSTAGSPDPPAKGACEYTIPWLENHGLLEQLLNGKYRWISGQEREHHIYLPRPLTFGPVEYFRLASEDEALVPEGAIPVPRGRAQTQHTAAPSVGASSSGAQQAEDDWQERMYQMMTLGFAQIDTRFSAMETSIREIRDEGRHFYSHFPGIPPYHPQHPPPQ